VLETASPPTFYIPPGNVNWELLVPAPGSSICEWKGAAKYWALLSNPEVGVAGWSYPDPTPAFSRIRDYISFYPAAVKCLVPENFTAAGLLMKLSVRLRASRERSTGNRHFDLGAKE
jgi:uncharacterized protein (DUF427 family)